MSINSKMTAIADEVRRIKGANGLLTLDDMADELVGISVQGAQTITPSTSAQSIAAGKYLSGAQTIAAVTKELLATLDADFVAGNIKQGVDILGLVGSLPSGTPVAMGTFTLSYVSNQIEITHRLGAVPTLVVVLPIASGFITSSNVLAVHARRSGQSATSNISSYVNVNTTSTDYWDTASSAQWIHKVTSGTFTTPNMASSMTYAWIAIVEADT